MLTSWATCLPGWLQVSLGLFLVMLGLGYYYYTSTFNYWRDRGVKFVKPYPVVGSVFPLLSVREHMLEFSRRVYNEYRNEPYVGYYQSRTPALLVLDPDIVKNIFVKDFIHFTDHGFKISEEADPLEAKNLFNMEGQKWKEMRNKLTPTFTSGRMKTMFPLVLDCAEQFEQHLMSLAGSGEEFEAKDLLSRYTIDVIGSCAFGIQCNSIKDPNCEFRVMGKRLVEVNFWKALKAAVIFFMPEISLRLNIAFLEKDLTEFFRSLVRDIISMRSKSGNKRKDFMQLLIELKEKGQLSPSEEAEETEMSEDKSDNLHSNVGTKWTNDDIAAQALVFFTAGFETSSTVMSFTLLELAMNTEIQRNLQKDIDEVLARHDGQLSYQSINEMHYLDKVIQETLRKYPPVAVLTRGCTKNYIFPETNVAIDKGILVIIPIHAMQNDPKYFPNPDQFDPERFSNDEMKQKNKYIYTPFGEGPRQCIGNRFALMQSKLGLIKMLHQFNVQQCTRTKYPASFSKTQFITSTEDGIWLKLASRQ